MVNNSPIPKNIKVLINTPENVSYLKNKFGEPTFFCDLGSTYLEFDTMTKEWRSNFDHVWLYRDIPPIINVTEL